MMEAARTCDCDRPDLRNFDDSLWCLSCGQINSNAASHVSLHKITSDEGYKQFDYRPLRSDSSFRLVRLHAGRREDDITCHIFHSTISDHPPFEALSYTWGEMAQSHKIFSTEGIVSITANCEAALRDLRYSFRDRLLWIDALCINQENDKEKNEQVPLMSRIYTAARRVVIYVGPDRRRDLDRFFAYFRSRSEPSACATDRVAQAAVSSFLSKPWFSRVWILQEVAVAKDAFLMWGTATLDWKYFSAAHLNILQLMPVDRSGKTPPVLLFTEGDTKPLKDLVSLIHTARSCRSTEPRDKIFALLGLLDDVEHTLKPDYNKPIGILQFELVTDIIKSYNHLDILALANTETGEEALCARNFAAKVRGMGSGVSFAESYIEHAAKVAHAKKRAEVGVAYLLGAEKDERQAWARLRYLETAWRQVQEAEDVWQEQHERYEALRDVQMKSIEWGASMNLQGTKWFWRKRKAAAQSERLQGIGEIGWKDSIAKENVTWEKWSELRKARWELAKGRAESFWIELKSTEEQERHELEILERELCELQEEERLYGVSMGIDIARRNYQQKHETWHELKARADEERSGIGQEEMKRQKYIKNETAKRRAFGDSVLALSKVLSQPRTAGTAKIVETAFHDHRSRIEESARNLLEDRKCAQLRLNEERKSWSEASHLDSHDDPKKPLLEAEQAWHDAKKRMDEAKNHHLLAQFNKESRHYEMLRREQSSYYPEIQRMISKELHSNVRFSGGQNRKNTSLRLPSWVPGLDDHQYLTSLACFRHRKSEYPEIVARQCVQDHNHTIPALEIRILKLDTIRTDRIPEAGSMRIDDVSPAGFGRAFLNTNSLPDKPWGTEREDFLSRFQQNYRSETRGSTFAQIQSFCQGRRRMLTEKSWVVCSGQVKMSDMVCAIYGASVPFVLRPSLGGQAFELKGECYLDGFLGPNFADEYLDLLGKFRQYFEVPTSDHLPWKTVCLE